jgi:hypothetical protein
MPWQRLWQEVWQQVWRLPCPDPCSAGLTRRAARRGSGIWGFSEPGTLSEWAARIHHNAGREGDHDPWLADSGRQASTIGRKAAAIGYRRKLAGHEPPTSQEGVRGVLRGIRRTIGAAREGKAPAPADALKEMLALCPDTLAGKRDRALLALGFAGGFGAPSWWPCRWRIWPRHPTACGSQSAAARRTRKGRGPRWPSCAAAACARSRPSSRGWLVSTHALSALREACQTATVT